MQKKRVSRILQKTIPAFHTFLIQQHDVCEKIKITLLFGSAQINGIQLKSKYPHFYTVPCSIPIYTWQGAQIQIQWSQYQNTKNQMVLVDITEQNKMQTPMLKYFQIHYNLILQRRYAFEQLKLGPRVGVVGTDQTAAQNVSRLLMNWSGKLNMNPVFVDLDPQSSFFVDGSIGAMQFQYKIAQDLFDRSKKITLYYGNRSIRSKSYLEQVKLLADAVIKKLQKQSYDYKLHGSKEQFPSFTAGLIIQFPKAKAKQNKKQHAIKIKQIIKIFQCTHVINVGFQELQHVMNDAKSQIQYIKCPPLQGTQSFLSLPRPVKSKIQRYLLNQSVLIKYPIAQIKIYELMTQKKSINQPTLQQRPQCRPIDIRQQTISKNTIAFLSGTLQQGKLDQFGLYKKALVCSVLGLGRIYSINENQVTFQVGHQNILYELKDHIWVTSVNDQ